jgi:hypothetical protein
MNKLIDFFNEFLSGKKVSTYKKIKEELQKNIKERFSQYEDRNLFINNFGFVMPCYEMIYKITKLSPIVSVGCGMAYIDKLLQLNGCDIISTDLLPPDSKKNKYRFNKKIYTDVICMTGAEAVKKYLDRNVLISWPCYNSDWSYYAIKEIRSGMYLIYIGENSGGCTGTDRFHDELNYKFKLIESVTIPRFYGIYDSCFIYLKK